MRPGLHAGRLPLVIEVTPSKTEPMNVVVRVRLKPPKTTKPRPRKRGK